MGIKKILGSAAAGAAANMGKKSIASDSMLESMKYSVGAGIAGKIAYDLFSEHPKPEDSLEEAFYKKE